jgi:hypothetical protein
MLSSLLDCNRNRVLSNRSILQLHLLYIQLLYLVAGSTSVVVFAVCSLYVLCVAL